MESPIGDQCGEWAGEMPPCRGISATLRFRWPGGVAAKAKTAFFLFIEDLSLRW